MALDSLDEKLIKLLVRDARQSSDLLAKQLGVSSSTVRRRIHKLTREQVISIVATPEPTKINLPVRVIVGFAVAHDKLNLIMERLGSLEEVRWLSATTGRFDILGLMWFSSTDELFGFMEKKVAKLEGVNHTETFVCLHEAKRT